MKNSLVFIFGFLFLACAEKNASTRSTASPVAEKPTEQLPTTAPVTRENSPVRTHVLQITALNFLEEGLELCGVKNELFVISGNDVKTEFTLCENSQVKVLFVSDAGRVTFRAVDRALKQDLAVKQGSEGLVLGKSQSMVRFYPEDPYGFTYVMAEEVTGVDPELLTQWNDYNSQLSSLRAKILENGTHGAEVPSVVLEEIKSIELKMNALRRAMKTHEPKAEN